MQKKRISKLATVLTATGFALSVFFCPMTELPVQAASGGEAVEPQADVIEWRYYVMDNKLYKRLYNCTTANWIGDWIYIRDL